MISHRSIMTNAAIAVRDTAAIKTYCVTHFGRGLDINVGAYAQGIPGADDSPFLWIQPKDENEDVNADQTFTVRFTVGGCVKGTNGEKVITNRITARTATANGLTVNGGNEIVEDLRDLVMAAVRDAKAGARVSAIRRQENDIAHFPLEWAEFFVDYFEPEALN